MWSQECAIKGCETRRTDPEKALFISPASIALRQSWSLSIGRRFKDFEGNNETYYVCEDHFKSGHVKKGEYPILVDGKVILRTRKKPTLFKKAVPTIFSKSFEMRRRKQKFNITNEGDTESDLDRSSPPKKIKLDKPIQYVNNSASGINSGEIISVSDKYNVPVEIKEEPVDIIEDEIEFVNLDSVEDMRDPLDFTPPQQTISSPKKVVKSIPTFVTKVIGQIPTTQVKGLTNIMPQNTANKSVTNIIPQKTTNKSVTRILPQKDNKGFRTVKIIGNHPPGISSNKQIILKDTNTLPSSLGNIIFAKMGENPPQAFVIQSNGSPVISNVTSVASSKSEIVQTKPGTTDVANKLQKIVIQPKFSSELLKHLKNIPTILKTAKKTVEIPKPASKTPEKLVQKIIIHPSKTPQNLPTLQAKPVLTGPSQTIDLTSIDLDTESPVVTVPTLTPNPTLKQVAPKPTNNVIQLVNSQPKIMENLVIVNTASKINVQPQNNVQPTDQQKIVAKKASPDKVTFNTGVKSILEEVLVLSAVKSPVKLPQKSVQNITNPVVSVPQRTLPTIIPQPVVVNDDVIVEPYNFESLKFDLSRVKAVGLPAFWCYLKASEGLLFMYLGDTQKHVSKSILIDPNMAIEVRAEGQIVKTNASKRINNIKDLYQIMEYISRACVCMGPTEDFCQKGLFEAKIVTQVNRCLECRSIRAKNLTGEQTEVERLKEMQQEIKKLRRQNTALRNKLTRNSRKKEKSGNT